MVRDWNIVREILVKIEASNRPYSVSKDSFENLDSEEVAYHMNLLKEAGLIDARVVFDHSGFKKSGIEAIAVKNLTFEGHDLLDTLRSDTTWNHAKEFAKTNGIAISLATINALVGAAAKQLIGGA